jgi:sugar/nucleoside kinase (ribokinase family)
MQALFIGQTYRHFSDRPCADGDEKYVASAYAVSSGGNAVTAAFCCGKLGIAPDVLTNVADDWLGRMFLDMAVEYGISIHARKVRTSSLSFIMPNDGKRAIVRCRDDDYLHPFPILHLPACRALHVDGHQPDAGDLLRQAVPGSGYPHVARVADFAPIPMNSLPSSTSRSWRNACASRWGTTRHRCSIILRAAAVGLVG